jgi:hypothetical protein
LNKKIYFPFLIALALIAGCSSHSIPNKPEQTSSNIEKARAGALSLDYVNQYFNETDINIKKAFVAEHIHPDTQSMFVASADIITKAEDKILNPQLIDSSETLSDGTIGYASLLKGDSETEIIVMEKGGKVVWGYLSTSTGDQKSNFDMLRKLFN